MSGPTTLQDQILMALRRITRAIDLRSRTLLQDYGLTAPQLATLNTVTKLQPVSVGEIAKQIHLGKPTVTGILNRLERRLGKKLHGGVLPLPQVSQLVGEQTP